MSELIKPDFVIIGAMKCGTTTLAAQLAAQPGIFVTTPKEPAFFSHDDIYSQGLNWYSELYRMAQPGDIKGEASTEYTKLPTYPDAVERLFAYAPDAKLIYITRDPVDRVISHYMHWWRDGKVSNDMDRAVRENPEFIEYSKYDAQLQPWIDRFGEPAILRLTMEDMAENPQAVLQQAAAHIGYQGEVHWRDDMDRMNPGVGHIRSFPLKRLLVDNPLMEVLRRNLVPKSWRLKVRKIMGLELSEKPVMGEKTRAYVLSELGKPLSER